MKRNLAVFAFALCGLFGTLALGPPKLGTQLQRDGGAPPPPWPSRVTTLVADGSAPPPPWPKGVTVLVADGSAPPPPWPKGGVVAEARG